MKKQKRAGNQRGQILILVTFAAIPMFAIAGLVTDLGYMQYVKKSTQAAADAAARAAMIQFHSANYGSSYLCGGSVVCQAAPQFCDPTITVPANAIQNGCLYAKQNGFLHSSSQDVTYTSGISASPPTTVGLSSVSYWVTFRVTQVVPMLFSAVAGNTTGMVTSRATAAITGGKDCIYALNPNQSGALSVGGTASLTSGCGLYVDSSDSSALGTNGGGAISAPEYDVVGGVSTHYALNPTPNTGASPAPDPLGGLPAPTSAPYTCDYKNYSAPNNGSAVTLSPGVYCGGINVKNNLYTLNPGNYILVGGGLTTQDANSSISGSGVFFYNTSGATNQGNQVYSPINIAATSTVNLTAPTSGTYTGILFFEDRSAPESSDSYGGGSSAVYQGTIYAKNADITMFGNSSVSAAYTILVANTIVIKGASGFNNNYSSLTGGSPIKQVSLVE
jgi:Flp pilus assembly protein TadG